MTTPPRIAVVGGGIAGLACAHTLAQRGISVTLFDRGRRVGGRMAARPLEYQHAGETHRPLIDHGSPAFEARSPQFLAHVNAWIDAGVCAPWKPKRATIDAHADTTTPITTTTNIDAGDHHILYVGTPTINAICAHLAGQLDDVRTSAHVRALARAGNNWSLTVEQAEARTTETLGPFGHVVLAAPPEQAARLLTPDTCTGVEPAQLEHLRASLAGIASAPQWVCLLALNADDPAAPDEMPALIDIANHPAISRIVREDAKPARPRVPGVQHWTIHSTSDWAAPRLDTPPEQIARVLTGAGLTLLTAVLDNTTPTNASAQPLLASHAHRWTFARARTPIEQPCLCDNTLALSICTDGMGGSGVEAACLSGIAAATQLHKQS